MRWTIAASRSRARLATFVLCYRTEFWKSRRSAAARQRAGFGGKHCLRPASARGRAEAPLSASAQRRDALGRRPLRLRGRINGGVAAEHLRELPRVPKQYRQYPFDAATLEPVSGS